MIEIGWKLMVTICWITFWWAWVNRMEAHKQTTETIQLTVPRKVREILEKNAKKLEDD